MKIILASKSPRRLEILKRFGFKVKVVKPVNVREFELGEMRISLPHKLVCKNARLKAESIPFRKDTWILASDTLVVLNGRAYGKPDNEKEAVRFLTELSGKTHEVYSSFCMIKNLREITGFDVSCVTFRSLSKNEIRSYIRSVHIMDKAGAYAIQEGGEQIISRLDGSYYNVMGLPIEKIIGNIIQS